MEAYLSNIAGILSFKRGEQAYHFDLSQDKEIDECIAEHRYSLANDTIVLQADNEDLLHSKANKLFWAKECASYLRSSFNLSKDAKSSLYKNLFEYVELIIDTNKTSAENVLNQLLIAPIEDNIDLIEIGKKSLQYNAITTTGIIDDLNSLQTILSQVVNKWLSITLDSIQDSFYKPYIWNLIIDNTNFHELLATSKKSRFESSLSELLFSIENARERITVKQYLDELSNLIYPHESSEKLPIEELATEQSYVDSNFSEKTDAYEIHQVYVSVKKQIDAIVEAIKDGKDTKADAFLADLISMQLESGKREHLIKSLCNVAKKSANIFRYDFEHKVLKKALKYSKRDQWTLVQYSDHLKRTGKYDDSLDVLEKASKLGEHSLIEKLRADVYSEMGNYQDALNIYFSLYNIDKSDLNLRNAIADIYRKNNELDKAEHLYIDILSKIENSIDQIDNSLEKRAIVGLAEVYKWKGKLDLAKEYYKRLLESEFSDNREYIIYNLGYCNVLQHSEEYEEAFKISDKILQEFPSFKDALFHRASLLGLISEEIKGLDVLKQIDSEQWDNWIYNFLKGLLLVKLERYEEAKPNLIGPISYKDFDENKLNLSRFGATLWYMNTDNLDFAQSNLKEVDNHSNQLVEHLKKVLEYHIAHKKGDNNKSQKIAWELKSVVVSDKRISKAIEAINNQDYIIALDYEINATISLMLAA